MGVSLFTFLALAVSLTLIPPTTPSCTTGSPQECREADFAPGVNLAGEGFDITKMQRKGAYVIDMNLWKRQKDTCLLCMNPYQEGKMQKVPAAVVDWRPKEQCNRKVSSSLHQSSETLVTSTTSAVENNWEVNLGININARKGSLMLAGSQSKLVRDSMAKTKKDKYTFISTKTACTFYSYRVSSAPPLHQEFLRAIRKLPEKYTTESKQPFYKLIDTFGTHYMTKVTLGGKVQSVTSIRQCLASLQGLNSDEIKTCLSLEAEASVSGVAQVGVDAKHCEEVKNKILEKNSFSSIFNDRSTNILGGNNSDPGLLFSADKDPAAYSKWLSSLPVHPDVISYSLDPLSELLNSSFPVRKELQKAIKHYILESGLWNNCSEPCVFGSKRNPEEPCLCTCHGHHGLGPDCCPTKGGLAQVIISVKRASGLWGDYSTSTDAFVRVFDSKNMYLTQTKVIWNKNSPEWNDVFNISDVILAPNNLVTFEVWDVDNKWDDDVLGICTVELKEGIKEDVCRMSHGELYYKIQVTCGPNLSGPFCTDYVSSPMNAHLERLYVSRHARPIPVDMLLKMGVFPDLDGHFNLTNGN